MPIMKDEHYGILWTLIRKMKTFRSLTVKCVSKLKKDIHRPSTTITFNSPENVIQHAKVFLAIRNMFNDTQALEIKKMVIV